MVEHRQIVNYVLGISEVCGLAQGFTYAMVQPLSVDSSQTVIFPCFASGGTLHVISEDEAMDPQALAACFSRSAIDVLKIAPSHLAALWQSSSQAEQLLPRCWLIVGGESSRSDWVAELQATARCAILNHYGPTEATVATLTYHVATGRGESHGSTVPIGRPLPNTEAYVLDRRLQPVPIGVAGELYIGGSCLARGYLGRPEVSAESFIPNPFGDQVGARLYRTGDVVRYRADGAIELLGRTDQQVKIRGFRVEPAEVATVLGAHPAVRNSLVVARDDRRGDRQLVAYVVRREGREASAAELRDFLGSKLPDYMVPSHFVGLDALPLTPHGKVDRSALPDPGTARPEMDSPFVPASSPVEVELAGIWAAVLEVERVGIHDNFFDLGGHSLSAFRLVSRVVQAFQLDLSLKALFDAPTVAEMARVIQAIGAKPATARVVQRMQGALDATSDERGQKGSAGLD
jgi:acyl-coenzyme A synthetase/AMP-(fatty) acid ligase/acyl carrier protein